MGFGYQILEKIQMFSLDGRSLVYRLLHFQCDKNKFFRMKIGNSTSSDKNKAHIFHRILLAHLAKKQIQKLDNIKIEGFPLSPKAYISNSSHCPISKYQANHKKNPNRTLASVAMASMQCYKPSNECSQPKSKDNSLVHKAAEMASCALKGNQQGHCATPGVASNQPYSQGQAYAYYPDQNLAKTQTYSQTQTHYPEHTMAKTQSYCHGQSNGHYSEQHAMAPAHGHGQHKDKGHHASNGMACHGKSTEKKMKEKKSEHKKEKSVTKKKSKECHRSCNDSDSSSSGSDSDWTWLLKPKACANAIINHLKVLIRYDSLVIINTQHNQNHKIFKKPSKNENEYN